MLQQNIVGMPLDVCGKPGIIPEILFQKAHIPGLTEYPYEILVLPNDSPVFRSVFPEFFAKDPAVVGTGIIDQNNLQGSIVDSRDGLEAVDQLFRHIIDRQDDGDHRRIVYGVYLLSEIQS